MMIKTPLKKSYQILILISLLAPAACGVKGPPEPPIPNEASVKKMPVEAVEPPEETPRPSPVIFPIKKEDGKPGKDKKTQKK